MKTRRDGIAEEPSQGDDPEVIADDEDETGNGTPSRQSREDSVHPPIDESAVSAWAVNFEEVGHLDGWVSYHKGIGDFDLETDKTKLVAIIVDYAKDRYLCKFADAEIYKGHRL